MHLGIELLPHKWFKLFEIPVLCLELCLIMHKLRYIEYSDSQFFPSFPSRTLTLIDSSKSK